LDAAAGTLEAKVDAAEWANRDIPAVNLDANQFGSGRELFYASRAAALTAEDGAGTFGVIPINAEQATHRATTEEQTL
jgi:phosphogluconate dehydratase